jgi:hypothetical protein
MYKKIITTLDSRPIRYGVVFIGILLIFIGGVIFESASSAENNALTTNIGLLNPPKIDTTKPITVALSGAIGNYTAQELANGIDLTRLIHIQAGNETVPVPIQITFYNGELQVSAKIYDEKGNTLAQIQNNQWKSPSSDSMTTFYRNYNSFAFEVIDSNGFPALQVLVAEQNQIRLGVNFFYQGQPVVATVKPNIYFFGTFNLTQLDIQQLRADTLFIYPVPEHIGKMNSVYVLSEYGNITKTYYNNPLSESTIGKWEGGIMVIIGMCIEAFIGIETVAERRRK